MVYDKELVVVFGGETMRRRYIKDNSIDPLRVVSACFPQAIGVMQVGEATMSFTVVRYPESEWSYIKDAFADQLADTESRLAKYKREGKTVMEITL